MRSKEEVDWGRRAFVFFGGVAVGAALNKAWGNPLGKIETLADAAAVLAVKPELTPSPTRLPIEFVKETPEIKFVVKPIPIVFIKASAEEQKLIETGIAVNGLQNALLKEEFSSTYAERVVYVIPLLLEAQNKTGINWKIFASFLGVEWQFLTSNPSSNSYGPFQDMYHYYQPGEINTAEEFVDICVLAAGVIEDHAKRVAAASGGTVKIDKVANSSLSLDQLGWLAYVYNGIAYGKGYKDAYKNSGYSCSWAEACGNRRNYWVFGWDGKKYLMDRMGFLGIYERLSRIEQSGILRRSN